MWLEYDLFKTMLLNLIDNAVKSGGSKVDVSGRFISHSIYRIAVSDNGRGIALFNGSNRKKSYE